MRLPPLLLTFLVATAAEPAGAQAEFARLRGRISDVSTGSAVRGARVIVAATGRYVTSDSAGRFDLRDLPTGVIRFVFAAEGFPRTSLVLAFAKGEVMEQDFLLDSTQVAFADSGDGRSRAQRLSPTTVTAEPSRGVRYEDFERRMRTGRGHYITRQEIEERQYNSLTDAVRGKRGVHVECASGARGCVIKMARAGQGCYPQYIVDGRPDPFFGPYVPVRDIEGLELYTGASDVPGEFAGTDAACGVVVIWTRSGPTRKTP